MGIMPGESKSSKRRIEAKERQKKALQMRLAGASFDQIAEALGYANRSGAYDAVQRVMKGIPEPEAKLYKKLNIERLNRLLVALWPTATRELPDKDIIAQAIRVIAEMNKLSGAYAPVESKITLDMVRDVARKIAEQEGTTEEMVMAEAEEIVKSMGF